MFENYTICPYPGLRSFNEEESIYFKGRDNQVIEVIELLQKNKFLMVTGASGDGKSSLIFGGLIPNAKAGFFKAKFSAWKIVHFRPERRPLKNLATSMANEFNISNPDSVETEISRGFSSLVDFYTGSKFYFEGDDSKQEAELKKRNKEAGNLLIIADQFEEFFTNPENFFKGAPTQEAQITVNLLLETARIALKRKLPIFVVFTMRSDFIGQCAAFRGLPEYIGFSQFFVPRLKRKDLQQVIEEPASLSGNRITRRLTERLIYDLEEGIDQLPILQHALNQIWRAADEGKEEMDLIHYAMVGGMPEDELPDEDKDRFKNWIQALPDWKRILYRNARLQKVIDIHADILYQSAWEYFNKNNKGKEISSREAKRIIALTFACLTKIDESRAVRNRMTLGEITRIINEPELNENVVAQVINLFREPGNTFIHPFISTEEPGSETLLSETVLDITHEALIRNWERLNKWAWKEFEYFETLADLRKQLDRWRENKKSSSFLLPIGPLLYFEKWFEECRPNTWWINRYNDESPNQETNLSSSEQLLKDIKQYLRNSGRRVIATKTITKYGPRKIFTAITIIVVIFLSGFYFLDAEKKQNEIVLENIFQEGAEMVLSKEVDIFPKGLFLVTSELNQEGSIMQILQSYPERLSRVRASNIAYLFLIGLDRNFKGQLKEDLINLILADLHELIQDESVTEENLEQYYLFLSAFSYDKFFNPDEYFSAQKDQAKADFYELLINILNDQRNTGESSWFHKSLNHLLVLGISPEQIDNLINAVSPFESDLGISNFQLYFPFSKLMVVGRNGSITHNAGYQVLGALYSAQGNVEKTLQCIDSIAKYNTNYFSERSANKESNLMEYFGRYNHFEEVDQFADYIAKIRKINKYEVYKEFVVLSGKVIDNYYGAIFNPAFNSYNTDLIEYPNYERYFDLYEKAIIEDNLSADKRNFELSLALKNKALFLHYYLAHKGIEVELSTYFQTLDRSRDAFRKVSPEFLEGTESFRYRYFGDGVRTVETSRNHIYKYPDHIGFGWQRLRYHSPLMVKYLLSKGEFNSFYTTSEELIYINDWLSNFLEVNPGVDQRHPVDPESPFLNQLRQELLANPVYETFDMNLIELLLANLEFEQGNIERGLERAREIDLKSLPLTATQWEYLNYTAIYNKVWRLALHMALQGNDSEAMAIIQTFPDANYKASVYSKLTQLIYSSNQKEKAFVYLDSAFSEMKKVDNGTLGVFDYRFNFLKALSEIGGKQLNNYALGVLTEMNEFKKPGGILELVAGIASEGNFFNARQAIPDNVSMSDELSFYNVILAEGAESNERNQNPELKGLWKAWLHFRDYIFFQGNF